RSHVARAAQPTAQARRGPRPGGAVPPRPVPGAAVGALVREGGAGPGRHPVLLHVPAHLGAADRGPDGRRPPPAQVRLPPRRRPRLILTRPAPHPRAAVAARHKHSETTVTVTPRAKRKLNVKSVIIWTAVSIAGAVAWGVLALARGEKISAIWLIVAALGSYAIAYRFYARFIAYKVLKVDDTRATPAERLEDGIDFHPTDRRVLLGHHFAAIAGAGPLVGPVLAAQMGYLPGTIWIIVGVIFAGAVQDMVTLFFSMRRNGKSLGQMARDEIGVVGGISALVGVFVIMIILLAVLALVVVNALAQSPWGTFSIAMTIPIALFMGFYLRVI